MDPEQLKVILDSIKTSKGVRATAWDAVMDDTATPEELQQVLDTLPLSRKDKSQLFDFKFASQPANTSQEQPEPGLLDRFNEGAEFGRQVVEGGLRQAATFPTRATQAVLDLGVNRLTPGVAEELRQPLQQFNEEVGPRDTTAQQIGAFGTEMAEFAIPGRLGRTAARLAPRAPRFARGATEAATGAVVAQAQGADPIGASVTAALTPLIPPTIQRIGRGLRRKSEQQMAQALGTTKEALKAVSEETVVPGMLKRKVKAGSLEALEQKAKQMARQVAKERSEIIRQIPQRNMRNELQSVQNFLTREKLKLKFSDVNKVKDIALYDEIVRVENEVADLFVRSGGNVSFKSMIDLRQTLETFIKNKRQGELGLISVFVKGATNPAIEANKKGANAIRRELAKSFPDFGKIQSEYHFWQSLKTIVSATKTRKQSQDNLGRIITGVGGAGVGAVGSILMGGEITGFGAGALLGGAAGAKLLEATRSVRWRTVSANSKHTIAKMLMSGAVDEASELALRLVGANVRPTVDRIIGPTNTPQQQTQ